MNINPIYYCLQIETDCVPRLFIIPVLMALSLTLKPALKLFADPLEPCREAAIRLVIQYDDFAYVRFLRSVLDVYFIVQHVSFIETIHFFISRHTRYTHDIYGSLTYLLPVLIFRVSHNVAMVDAPLDSASGMQRIEPSEGVI